MGRVRRIHAPGAALHVTALLQECQEWFLDCRDDVAEIICEGARSFGHQVYACAVMPTHFHIVLKQSNSQLGWAMQRIMQRTALRVKKERKIRGHVFSGPYWSRVCDSPRYVRSAITYTHLNAWEARLCDDPIDYSWTSHGTYTGESSRFDGLFDPWPGLMFFAHNSLERRDVVQRYQHAVREVMRRRRNPLPGDWLLPSRYRKWMPTANEGDSYWATSLASPHTALHYHRDTDIRDDAVRILKRLDPECDIDMLRHAGRLKAIAPIRRELIAALKARGHQQSGIARCIRVSPALVSIVGSEIRESVARKH